MTIFASFRTGKIKSLRTVVAAENHNLRIGEQAANVDTRKSKNNIVLRGSDDNIAIDVKNRRDAILQGKKFRKDGVLAVEYVLSASPEFFKGMNKKQVRKWANDSTRFLEKTYGKENVINSVLHLDEKTPHIHVIVTPEHQGKFNCKHFLGGKAKISKQQTDYVEWMNEKGHKLERGQSKDSTGATHVTTKQYQANLAQADRIAKKLEKQAKPLSAPPAPKLLETKTQYFQRVGEYINAQNQNLKRLVKNAGKVALAHLNYKDKFEGGFYQMKTAKEGLEKELQQAKEDLEKAYEVAGYSKEDIKKFRNIDVSKIAKDIGYFDEIPKKTNAIDLLINECDFTYKQAVGFLIQNYDGEVMKQEILKEYDTADISAPERPFTPTENAIKKKVKDQVDALGCKRFRISLVPASGEGRPFLPGKGKDGTEKFFDKDSLVNLIPMMRAKNELNDMHVFITPIDDECYYVLLDDMRVSEEELFKQGFTPCIIQNSSKNSKQAILKVPNDLDRNTTNEFFKELNQKAGDQKITGLRHGFRLAGFRNCKPKHLEQNGTYPIVEMSHNSNTFCKRSMEIIQHRFEKENKKEASLESNTPKPN